MKYLNIVGVLCMSFTMHAMDKLVDFSVEPQELIQGKEYRVDGVLYLYNGKGVPNRSCKDPHVFKEAFLFRMGQLGGLRVLYYDTNDNAWKEWQRQPIAQ